MQAMQLAGIEGQQVVLLIEDHQFVDPQFLELTNSLLSAGEVPGLYTPEELEPLLAPIKDQASDAGFRGTIAQYFASREYIIITLYNKITFWLIFLDWDYHYLCIVWIGTLCVYGHCSLKVLAYCIA